MTPRPRRREPCAFASPAAAPPPSPSIAAGARSPCSSSPPPLPSPTAAPAPLRPPSPPATPRPSPSTSQTGDVYAIDTDSANFGANATVHRYDSSATPPGLHRAPATTPSTGFAGCRPPPARPASRSTLRRSRRRRRLRHHALAVRLDLLPLRRPARQPRAAPPPPTPASARPAASPWTSPRRPLRRRLLRRRLPLLLLGHSRTPRQTPSAARLPQRLDHHRDRALPVAADPAPSTPPTSCTTARCKALLLLLLCRSAPRRRQRHRLHADTTATALSLDPSSGELYVDEGDHVVGLRPPPTPPATASARRLTSRLLRRRRRRGQGQAYVADGANGQVDVYGATAALSRDHSTPFGSGTFTGNSPQALTVDQQTGDVYGSTPTPPRRQRQGPPL